VTDRQTGFSSLDRVCIACSAVKRRVFSLLQEDVSVSVGSRSDNGKELHSFGAQAAKLRGPKVLCHAAADTLQVFKVNGSKVKVTCKVPTNGQNIGTVYQIESKGGC